MQEYRCNIVYFDTLKKYDIDISRIVVIYGNTLYPKIIINEDAVAMIKLHGLSINLSPHEKDDEHPNSKKMLKTKHIVKYMGITV